MKYKASITNEVKFAVVILLGYLVLNVWVSSGNNSVENTITLSLWILAFTIIFIFALIKLTYIIIENNKVKYVNMFLQRNSLEISKINKIQRGVIGGLFKFLLLTYTENGRTKHIKISPLSFRKETLKQFVSDLKKQNPQIDLDKSVNEFILE